MARRATTKKTARKTAAKKGAARRSTAKKSTAKRSTAKKSTAKRSTAKKTASRRASGKTAARRSTFKTATRRSSAKTSRKSAAKSGRGRGSARKTARREPLAIQLLKQDHREVEAMGKEFEKAKDDQAKVEIARRICQALTVHAQIEEEIFYPRAREQDVEDDMLDEAYVEHQSAKDLIAQIEGMGADDLYFEAKVKVLIEYVQHHVEEEENELFPAAQKTGLDLDAIGEEMQARKQELMQGAM